MARRSRLIGGSGGLLARTVWMFIVACIAVAIFRDAFVNPRQFWADLHDKSSRLEATVKRWVSQLGLTDHEPPPADTQPTPADTPPVSFPPSGTSAGS